MYFRKYDNLENMYIDLSERLDLHFWGTDCIISNDRGEQYRFRKPQSDILELCNGQKRVSEIIETICKRFHASQKELELAKDKTLALYLKVNFYEDLKDIRRYKMDKTYINNAIHTCKKVIEQSKNRVDRLGKTLTYLYEMKLVSLYSNEEDFEQAIKIAILHPDKPTSCIKVKTKLIL